MHKMLHPEVFVRYVEEVSVARLFVYGGVLSLIVVCEEG